MRSAAVVIPAYNEEEFIAQSVQSALRQTFEPVEVLVVDDGSTDTTREVVERFPGARLLISDGNGPCAARNMGVRASEADYLLFLDADDVLSPGTVEQLVETLEQSDDDLAFSGWRRLFRRGDGWTVRPSGMARRPPENDELRGYLSGWFYPPCAILWRRELFERVDGWDADLDPPNPNGDGDIMMRALLKGGSVSYCDSSTVYYRRYPDHQGSLAGENFRDAVLAKGAVVQRIERMLRERDLVERYRDALGMAYYRAAKSCYHGGQKEAGDELLDRATGLAGAAAINGSRWHELGARLLGPRRVVELARSAPVSGLRRMIRRATARDL